MPIQVNWDNAEKSIIHLRQVDIISRDDFYTALAILVRLLKLVSHRVDIIYSRSNYSHVAVGSLIYHFRYALAIMPSNSRFHIFVNPNPQSEAVLVVMKNLLYPQ